MRLVRFVAVAFTDQLTDGGTLTGDEDRASKHRRKRRPIPDAVRDELQLLTPAQVAELLQVTPAWVYLHATKGNIPNVKLGGNVRFRPRDIAEYLEAHERAGPDWPGTSE